jgi:hypothetical protein
MNLFTIENDDLKKQNKKLKKQINTTSKRPEPLESSTISYLSPAFPPVYQSPDFRLLNKSNIPDPKEFDSDKQN